MKRNRSSGCSWLPLSQFTPVKRRLEVIADRHGITVYDDFAHHPTAIRRTVEALKSSGRHRRIMVVLEFASYSMRSGVHRHSMEQALQGVDGAYLLQPKEFSLEEVSDQWPCPHQAFPNVAAIVDKLSQAAHPGDAVLVMSNRGFDNIHQQLAQRIDARFKLESV